MDMVGREKSGKSNMERVGQLGEGWEEQYMERVGQPGEGWEEQYMERV